MAPSVEIEELVHPVGVESEGTYTKLKVDLMSSEEEQKVASSIGVDGLIKLSRGRQNTRVEDIESFEGSG
jgi:hypothetical protein